jgi:hypothetical protein
VSRIDRVFVEDGLGQIVFEDWVLNGAEDAVVHGYFLFQIEKQKDLFINLEAICESALFFYNRPKRTKKAQRDQGPLTPLLFIRGF